MLPNDLVCFVSFLSLAGKAAVLTFTVGFVVFCCCFFLSQKEYSSLFFLYENIHIHCKGSGSILWKCQIASTNNEVCILWLCLHRCTCVNGLKV